MDQKLYDMMDWARIEALAYAEEDHPRDVLGAHRTQDQVLIQAYDPRAVSMEVICGSKVFAMEEADAGFFAVLLGRKTVPQYRLHAVYKDGSESTYDDPYAFSPALTAKDTGLLQSGLCYDVWKKLGAHPMKSGRTDGVQFAVWAPDARSVSVVGDFTGWDGRCLPMQRMDESGVFALFVPGLPVGSVYKYEIHTHVGNVILKADPYANAFQMRPDTGSVVADLSGYDWQDREWMRTRKHSAAGQPMAVYQVHLGSYMHTADGAFASYGELADSIIAHVKACGYTHVELLPVMEHPLDESCGFQISGYYAPTSRFGGPRDFMAFVDAMHRNGIGVILDWSPSQFPSDDFALSRFDGTCLYEHLDPRRGVHPVYGTHIFNFGRPEVRNFLIGSALFWAEVYHADGLKLDSVSAMIYLSYGRTEGQWVTNAFGGNVDLDALEMIKHLNSIMKTRFPGCLMIAEEDTGYPRVTGDLKEDGLGFDLKWDNAWTDSFLGYMQLDPIFRGAHHAELTFPMEYHYSEKFMLALGQDEMGPDKGSMLAKMPGKPANKMANLRAAYGFQIVHPGKKLLFMGQDYAQKKAWSVTGVLSAEEARKPENAMLTHYVKDLLSLYRKSPALYALDDDPAGFEWINNFSANENMLVFLRRDEKEEDTLLVVLNFSALTYEKRKIGVPWPGKYKEIFNSDHVKYGGSGAVNPRVKKARKDECDNRDWSVRITVPPLGMSIFRCTPDKQ